MELKIIKRLLAEQFGMEEDDIVQGTSFEEDLNADSVDAVELIMAIEEEFDLTIDDEAAENIKTVGDLVAFIKENVEE